MCIVPKAPKIPPPVERQAQQPAQEPMDRRTGLHMRKRRGFWASIMTGPKGLTGLPRVTGSGSAITGG